MVEKRIFAVWQKPLNHNCIVTRTEKFKQEMNAHDQLNPVELVEKNDGSELPLCTIGSDPDASW